jgi:hypothetical protein
LATLAALMLASASSAQARPVSTAQELDYLTNQLSTIATAGGYQLDVSSITLEPSHVDLTNVIYNFGAAFYLTKGRIDDRAYTVYFEVSRNYDVYEAQVHFRTTVVQPPIDCVQNNTTYREVIHSSAGTKEVCLALHISIWAKDLAEPVNIENLIVKKMEMKK